MKYTDSEEIQIDSATDIYKQENQFNVVSETRTEDPKSIIRVGQENDYLRALPSQTSNFCWYIFICLFNIFKQWHVIYFIVSVVAKTFLMCNFYLQSMIAELVLICIYLILQVVLRYKTYKSYVFTQQKLRQNVFQIWSKEQNRWVQTSYSTLKPGHIIKVISTVENDNVLNPVNILPIFLPSRRNHFQLKTTKIDKFQQVKQIPLFHPFKKIISEQDKLKTNIQRLRRIRISYEYTIQNSDVFQGRLKVDENQSYYISNKLILPQGVPIIGEQYIIGVVLINFSNMNSKSLKRALSAQNQTSNKMRKTLIPLSLFFLLIGITTFIIQFLIIITNDTKKDILTSQSQAYLCIALGIVSLMSYFIYVAMFIFLLIHRLRDSWILQKKNEIFIKNYVKSIDQFGQTNTIIMDDYFFIDKNLFEVQQMICNHQSEIDFDQELIFSIIEKSERFKQEMYDLWMSAFRYFQAMPRRYTQMQSKYQVQILKEKIFKQSFKYSTITLVVGIRAGGQIQMDRSDQLSTKRYIFRLTQKPRHTTIERIKDQRLKVNIRSLVKDKSLLHLMIEVMKIEASSSDIQNDNYQLISRNFQPTKFQFLAIISSKLNPHPHTFPLSLIQNQQIIKKQNLIIMSNKKWKYIQLVLEKKNVSTGHIISLEEKEFQNVKYDIEYHLKQLRQINNLNLEKHAILAIHCNLVSYLTRPQMIRGLIKLARYSKYIIFYDCSQYEKQVCCMNLFQIFPLHIYLSNYLCDLQLIEKSNLSVCQRGESTQPYVTLVVKRYKDLRFLILKQAVQSINISVFIVRSFLFKNQILILSMMLTQFMVYQGRYFVLGAQYTGLLFLTYNLFTSLPVLYYVIFRPQIWQQPIYKNNDPNKIYNLQYITDSKMIKEFIRAAIISVIITLLNYSFLASTLIQNMFFSILTSCVVASGYYQLLIDDARKKKVQVMLAIAVYFIFYVYIYFMQLWNTMGYQLVLIQTNLTTKDTVYFFLSNLLIVPMILGFVFYGMSVLNAKITPEQNKNTDLVSQISSIFQLPAKTIQQYGKQLRFRQE